MFQIIRPLYLASSSPRRVAFFRELGLEAAIVPAPDGAEPLPLPGEEPRTYALRGAGAKAISARSLLGAASGSPAHALGGLIIAADTVVALKGRIFGKPRDAEDAFAMLAALGGTTHEVITGCVILAADEATAAPLASFAVTSLVSMWDAPPDLLRAYAYSGEPLDKAGAYAVQGAGAFLVRAIDGSWSNVVGLPLAELVQELLRLGAVRATPGLPEKSPTEALKKVPEDIKDV